MPNLIDRHVGAQLRALRTKAGYSQSAVGRCLSKSVADIAAFEAGQIRIRAAEMFALCDLFNVRRGVFFRSLGHAPLPLRPLPHSY